MTDQYPTFVIEYEDKRCELTPVARQEYTNCYFEAGFVAGHPDDKLYLRLGREDKEPTIVLLRNDEAMALLWVMTGTLWSDKLNELVSIQREEVSHG